MKRIAMMVGLLLVAGSAGAGRMSDKMVFKGEKVLFDLYSEERSNVFICSGMMGNWGDFKVDQKCTTKPRSGKTCTKILYTAANSQQAGWAGIFWQFPSNNWGLRPGTDVLKGAKKLVFWARGARGGEVLEEVGSGGVNGLEYIDSGSSRLYGIELTNKWQRFELDISDEDWSSVIGGFVFAVKGEAKAFYFDDIYFQ